MLSEESRGGTCVPELKVGSPTLRERSSTIALYLFCDFTIYLFCALVHLPLLVPTQRLVPTAWLLMASWAPLTHRYEKGCFQNTSKQVQGHRLQHVCPFRYGHTIPSSHPRAPIEFSLDTRACSRTSPHYFLCSDPLTSTKLEFSPQELRDLGTCWISPLRFTTTATPPPPPPPCTHSQGQGTAARSVLRDSRHLG